MGSGRDFHVGEFEDLTLGVRGDRSRSLRPARLRIEREGNFAFIVPFMQNCTGRSAARLSTSTRSPGRSGRSTTTVTVPTASEAFSTGER